MLVNCFVFLIFSFIFICWSWDRPIVMRFIHICFDHRSFPFYYCFGLHNPRMKSLVEWASSKRFCTLKGLKSIQKLTNWTAKRRIKGTGHACSEKWIHWTTEFKWISIACSKKKNLFWGLLLFWKKKKKKTKNIKLCYQLVLRPMLSYLIVFKPWMVSSNVLLFFYHNVIVFLCFFLKDWW